MQDQKHKQISREQGTLNTRIARTLDTRDEDEMAQTAWSKLTYTQGKQE